MFNSHTAAEMADKFVDSLPPTFQIFKQEIAQQLRAFLLECFNKMEIVTQQEFAVQAKILEKTRLKLEKLEYTLADLEERLNKGSKPF